MAAAIEANVQVYGKPDRDWTRVQLFVLLFDERFFNKRGKLAVI